VSPDEQSFYRAFMRSARLRGDIEAASIPGITGVWCHEVGGSRLFNAISISQRYAGHARQVGHAAATVHSGAYLGRYTIVVDDDIDVMDLEEVLWAMCTRSDPSESIDIIPRMWSGPLDPRIHPDRKGLSHSYLTTLGAHDRPTPGAIETIARALDLHPSYFAEYRLNAVRGLFDERQQGLAQALHNLQALRDMVDAGLPAPPAGRLADLLSAALEAPPRRRAKTVQRTRR